MKPKYDLSAVGTPVKAHKKKRRMPDEGVGFRITPGLDDRGPPKGFHITFANGWTVSVQWGPGTYSDNYDKILEFVKGDYPEKGWESQTAEVWAWKGEEQEGHPEGYLTPEQVTAYMKMISEKQ
jgi:hypothetical protein